MLSDSPYAARPWLDHYDPWVRPRLDYPPRVLHDILSTAARDFPDRLATAFLGATLTYRELKHRSDRLAAALSRRGIAKGDRIAIMLPNCPQYVISVFAILRLGASIVNINPGCTPRELLTIAADAGLRAIVTLDTQAPLGLDLKASTTLMHVIVTSLAEYSAAAVATAPVAETDMFADLIDEDSAVDVPAVSCDPEDLAVLQYTSGTSGAPRGAMLTHANIFANVIQTEAFMYGSKPADERYLIVIPFFNMYAFTAGMMRGTWIGALQILLPKYEATRVLQAIHEFQPTHVPAVAAIYASLLKHPRVREYRLDGVRAYNAGGEPCPPDLIARWEALTTRPLNQGYGLSQTSPVTHMTPQQRRRPGTIGLPLPNTDIKIVDVETGMREVPIGARGELCIAGPQVMRGYWNQPDETARALRRDREGRIWLYTGDIARMDEDGFTTILERNTPCGD